MTRKINVLQLGGPKALYGAERWILALIRHLDRSKISTWVAAVKDEPEYTVPLCEEAGRMGHSTKIFENFGKLNLAAVTQVRKFIREKKIDVLHTHGYKTDMIGILACAGTPCKIITTPHGWTKDPDLKLRIYEIVDRMIFPFFDAVVPLSDELDRQLRGIPGLKGRLHLIRNGVDVTEIQDVTDISDAIIQWKKENCFIIGYIGRLTSGKGIDTLFEAVARSGKPNWRVVLIGEGEQKEELESLADNLNIKHNVSFLGYREDRLNFLKGFDVFVLPSRSEGIPRCVMEAMGAEVPVVATDIPGCRFLVDSEKTGLLFQPNDPGELTGAIGRLEHDRILRERLTREARVFIDMRFSAVRMAKEYEDLYLKLNGMPNQDERECLAEVS